MFVHSLFFFFLILKSLILTCVPKHEPPSHSLLICVVRVSNSKSNESLATEVSGLRKMSDEEKHDPILLATKYPIMKAY